MGKSNGEGHVDGFDDSEEIGEEDVVTLVSEDGDEYTFVVLAIVEMDGAQYAMLAPLEQIEDASDPELELYLFTYTEDDEGAIFGEIEDEATYEAVQAYCATLLDTEGIGLSEVEPGEA